MAPYVWEQITQVRTGGINLVFGYGTEEAEEEEEDVEDEDDKKDTFEEEMEPFDNDEAHCC